MSDKARIEELEQKLSAAEAEIARLKPEERHYELPESARQALVDYMGNAPSGSVPGRVPMQLVGMLQGLRPIPTEEEKQIAAKREEGILKAEKKAARAPRKGKRKLNGAEDGMRESLRVARGART